MVQIALRVVTIVIVDLVGIVAQIEQERKVYPEQIFGSVDEKGIRTLELERY